MPKKKPILPEEKLVMGEIAQELHVTRQRAHQIQTKALQKLKEALAKKKINKLDDII